MAFDPEDPNSNLYLTRALQALASANTRKLVEMLALAPRGVVELCNVFDLTAKNMSDMMRVLQEAGLVSQVKTRDGNVYVLDGRGISLARSWLDRIASIVDGAGHS
jgi:DNA-binding IclR family transcriptional regulator